MGLTLLVLVMVLVTVILVVGQRSRAGRAAGGAG
jgi:hypothetical protein